MKISQFLFLALLGLSVSLIACNSKKDDAATQEGTTVSPEGTTTPAATMGDPNATTSTGGMTTSGGTELHYKCPTAGCTGGGDAQGKCPICGADLVHNQAFHAQAQAAPGSSPTNTIQIGQSGTTGTATPTPPAEKNAKGEYHYKCTKAGCTGGAATQVACPVCGSPTAHNQAYHN